MTVRVLAGTPVTELDAALAASGQCVALPSWPGATVGGVLAVGHSGIRRLGWGPVRDTVLEARYVTGERAGREGRRTDGQERQRLRPVPPPRRLARHARVPRRGGPAHAPHPEGGALAPGRPRRRSVHPPAGAAPAGGGAVGRQDDLGAARRPPARRRERGAPARLGAVRAAGSAPAPAQPLVAAAPGAPRLTDEHGPFVAEIGVGVVHREAEQPPRPLSEPVRRAAPADQGGVRSDRPPGARAVLRCEPRARRRRPGRVRAVRAVPAALPHVPGHGRRVRLAPWAHRARCATCSATAHRSMPPSWVHRHVRAVPGLRDGVPIGRALRAADDRHPSRDRAWCPGGSAPACGRWPITGWCSRGPPRSPSRSARGSWCRPGWGYPRAAGASAAAAPHRHRRVAVHRVRDGRLAARRARRARPGADSDGRRVAAAARAARQRVLRRARRARGHASPTRRVMAARALASMPGEAPILVDSAGCGAALKAHSERVLDVHEMAGDAAASRLPRAPPRGRRRGNRSRVQDPCHLRHVQRAHQPVRTVLAALRRGPRRARRRRAVLRRRWRLLPRCTAAEAVAIRERKLAVDRPLRRVGGRVSANPGCSLHLAAAGLDVRHPVSLDRRGCARMADVEDLRDRLASIAEDLTELAITELREAVGSGGRRAPERRAPAHPSAHRGREGGGHPRRGSADSRRPERQASSEGEAVERVDEQAQPAAWKPS